MKRVKFILVQLSYAAVPLAFTFDTALNLHLINTTKMPPQRRAPRLGQADYAVHRIPWVQLGLNANSWTRQKLRTILDHYKVHYRPNSLKMTLMTHLAKLNKRLLRTKGRKLTAHDRTRILKEQGMGAPPAYDRHMAEVLRYAVNYGNHNGDLSDFPYVQAMIDGGPGPRDALLRSEFGAIVSDFELYKQAYQAGSVRDLEDDGGFSRVYGRMRRPQKSYTPECRDYLMSRLLPRVRARYIATFGIETVEEEEDDGTSEKSASTNDEEERSESESTVTDIISSSCASDTSTSSSYASDMSEDAMGCNHEGSAEDRNSPVQRKKTWSVTPEASRASSSHRRYAWPRVQLPQHHRSMTPETPTPKLNSHLRLGLGHCPRCKELGVIVKTRYYVATTCESSSFGPCSCTDAML